MIIAEVWENPSPVPLVRAEENYLRKQYVLIERSTWRSIQVGVLVVAVIGGVGVWQISRSVAEAVIQSAVGKKAKEDIEAIRKQAETVAKTAETDFEKVRQKADVATKALEATRAKWDAAGNVTDRLALVEADRDFLIVQNHANLRCLFSIFSEAREDHRIPPWRNASEVLSRDFKAVKAMGDSRKKVAETRYDNIPVP